MGETRRRGANRSGASETRRPGVSKTRRLGTTDVEARRAAYAEPPEFEQWKPHPDKVTKAKKRKKKSTD